MFVDMVFLLRKDIDIQRFKIRWDNSVYDDSVIVHVNRWSLIAAVKHNVQEIMIAITHCRNLAYEIPYHILNCKSLRKLEMQVFSNASYVEMILPRSMNLPQLKLLSFTGVSISNAEASKRLFSSCPVLETLRLVDCDVQTDDQKNLIVDSLSLKEFEYSHRRKYLLRDNDTMANIIRLCAPNLEVFTCKSFLRQDYSLENSFPLSRVNFNMKLKAKKEDENAEAYSNLQSTEKEVHGKRMMQFLRAVYLVTGMRLSSPGFLEVFSRAPDSLDCQPPRLCNLKYLTLEMWCTRSCLRAIAYLLKISPHITQLLLKNKESNLADVGDGWEAGLSSPGMLSHLELVGIIEVEGCDNELKFLRFLLKNAMALKTVVLYPRSTVASPDRVRKQFLVKLRASPRASSCIIVHWEAANSTHLI
ncbi:hypothetical protein C5167_029073 [Papaver somniferum]|uniref:F-box protein At3g62430-like n=1 Tax=Papaver somniferum TaxID=3469 RepID=UPI000E6FAAC4|nr:F-box protein At3g62430-like [Papaver somniferum]RZC90006.1 hypothetical protein C5167_029073 [Papaver somniferum]